MKLRHIHLPGLTPYHTASKLQSRLVAHLLALKSPESSLPSFPPTILTAEFQPIYTSGIRERVPAETIARLTALGADFAQTERGGQMTFHGPGQLVAYPLLDLQRARLSARCYVRGLEEAVIRTAAAFGVRAVRTDDVGVWVPKQQDGGAPGEERKLASVGVRLRRFVASHGVGINVSTDLKWFREIVACGLVGREATSLAEEGVDGLSVEQVGQQFVRQMAREFNADEKDVQAVQADDIERELDNMGISQ